MSGIAITIPNGRFNTEFGQVVQELISTPVTGVHITCNDNYIGTQYRLSCQFTPLKTNQRNVVWSIVSGSDYAAIDSTTGLLTIFESANNNYITVKCTSAHNSSIYDTKQIMLLYKRSAIPDRLVKSIGNLSNVEREADQKLGERKMLVKEANTTEWTQAPAPPNIVTNLTEDEVLAMIDNGTIDDNTLYFCEE